jgi:hypothetical protein
MVMITKDIVMSNLTGEEGTGLKISTPRLGGGNAARSPMTTLPSFSKGKRAKDHATSTFYAIDQKIIGK